MSAFNPTTPRFKENVKDALANPNIQRAMREAGGGFAAGRARARAEMPEFDGPPTPQRSHCSFLGGGFENPGTRCGAALSG